MDKAKKKRLEAKGWKFGSVTDLLGLTPADEAWIEMKLRLVDRVRELRKEKKMTQAKFAKLIGVTQSRVARLEVGADKTVSVEALMKALVNAGESAERVATTIGGNRVVVVTKKKAKKKNWGTATTKKTARKKAAKKKPRRVSSSTSR